MWTDQDGRPIFVDDPVAVLDPTDRTGRGLTALGNVVGVAPSRHSHVVVLLDTGQPLTIRPAELRSRVWP